MLVLELLLLVLSSAPDATALLGSVFPCMLSMARAEASRGAGGGAKEGVVLLLLGLAMMTLGSGLTIRRRTQSASVHAIRCTFELAPPFLNLPVSCV
jgi:hypothetical protein